MGSHQQYFPPPPDPDNDSPTVGPLRINKTASPAPSQAQSTTSTAATAGQSTPQTSSGRYRYSADDPHRPSISGYGTSGGKQGPSRDATPKPLPESPGPELPDKDKSGPGYPQSGPGSAGRPMPTADHFIPRPVDTTASQLHVPEPQGVNRAGTNVSAHTTRAERGSPPPPETPVDGAGPASQLRVPANDGLSAAAAQRDRQYSGSPLPAPNPIQAAPQQAYRAYSAAPAAATTQPTPNIVSSSPGPSSQQVLSGQAVQGLSLGEEPPPAYSSTQSTQTGASSPQGYPVEKRNDQPTATPGVAVYPPALQTGRTHPAFANDSPAPNTIPSHPAAAGISPIQTGQQQQVPLSAAPSLAPASPPPLPEGWIAHLDPNSGQYYYIHLPTQSTQWEFPKGPMPLSMQEPPRTPAQPYASSLASPTFSTYGKPMPSPAFPSPGYPPQYPYHDNISGVAGMASPTASVFSGPPPNAGVDMYKVVPTNGVYFGPYLRYTNIDMERSLWLGSILIITDTPHPPTVHIHQTTDLSPNPRQLKANPIYSHQRWLFYRYDIDLLMEESPTKWTYAITSHLGCTRYEFVVAGRHDPSWRFITHSGNDFALSVSANDRAKVGGLGLMWKDVLSKHEECGGFHAQIGLGGQIYADRLWQDVPMLKQWITLHGKDNRKNAPWTAKHEEDTLHAYFHFYTSHFDQPHLREAFAKIPNILTIDDHDIFDGYGSYPDYMQQSNVFKSIGRIGIDMYLLFQHHTTHEILRHVNNDLDLFTITGTGWHFIKYLGPAVVVVGPDTRSERTSTQVLSGPTYQGLLPKVAVLPPCVQHCIWLFPVPLIYPRLHSAQQIASTINTSKRAVTGTFNMLGKVTSSVAGVIGAKDVVNDSFASVKKAVGKSGLMAGILSPFGDVDFGDELRDLWTHESKDLERTYIIRTLQGISHNKSVRMTFLSGSVNVAGAGLVHDPSHPHDHKTMYQLISSAIVNAPPNSMVLRLLNTNPKVPLYVPPNGRRSTITASSSGAPPPATDTKEDMLEIFFADPDGRPRDMKRLMGRRNYIVMVAYDPEAMRQQQYYDGSMTPGLAAKFGRGQAADPSGLSNGKLGLSAEFIVQHTDGGYGGSVKYGPVLIPSLEYGR